METDHTPRPMNRRHFLKLFSIAAAGFATGCAVNPVTGKPQLMLVPEERDVEIDRKYAPMQFSADYGPLQNKALNRYINRTGLKIAHHTHRPNMPYSFRGVNAVHMNAYAFPGGSIAITRGMLIELENEAQLAAIIGHELGHVNARHTAQQMTANIISQVVVTGASLLAASEGYGDLASQLGMFGKSVFLASYSREDEREADKLGMEYMVKAGYNPYGMVEVMDILRRHSHHKGGIAETLFADHPMSEERYETALKRARTKYSNATNLRFYHKRFMSHTVDLRRKKHAIKELQQGQKYIAKKQYVKAKSMFIRALKEMPRDYAGLLMMAKLHLIRKEPRLALPYAKMAKKVYPQEAQAYFISGYTELQLKRYKDAYNDFDRNERILPGNPTIIFFKGYALEGMGKYNEAAKYYYRYLQQVNTGKFAQYAYNRLLQWGYLHQ